MFDFGCLIYTCTFELIAGLEEISINIGFATHSPDETVVP